MTVNRGQNRIDSKWQNFLTGFLAACVLFGVVYLSADHGSRTYLVKSACSALGSSTLNGQKKTFLIEAYPVRGPVPWEVINQELRDAYTLGGSVPMSLWMLNGLRSDDVYTPGQVIDYSSAGEAIVWPDQRMQELINAVKEGKPHSSYGEQAAQDVLASVTANPVKGKTVLVIGSVNPWVEAIVLHEGAAQVVTVDFNKPQCNFPRVRTLSVAELDQDPTQYDAVFTFSSLEHDGLGRYGDPLHPNGDIERVKKIRELIKEGGLFFLSVPIGKDHLYWNAHRIYGKKRFPMLLGEGWQKLGVYRAEQYDWNTVWDRDSRGENQPVHVFRKIEGPNVGSVL